MAEAIRGRPPAADGLRKAGLRARAGQVIPAERAAFPDPKIQWLEARHSAYRCGGSTGLAFDCVTGFPFHSGAVQLRQSTVRKASSLSGRRGRILPPTPHNFPSSLNFIN